VAAAVLGPPVVPALARHFFFSLSFFFGRSHTTHRSRCGKRKKRTQIAFLKHKRQIRVTYEMA
jgi:hypothetical protein